MEQFSDYISTVVDDSLVDKRSKKLNRAVSQDENGTML